MIKVHPEGMADQELSQCEDQSRSKSQVLE